MKNIIIIALYITLFIIGATWVEQPGAEHNRTTKSAQLLPHASRHTSHNKLTIEMLARIQDIETQLTNVTLENNQSRRTRYITQATNDIKALQELAKKHPTADLNIYAREYLKVNSPIITIETLKLLHHLQSDKKNINYILSLLLSTNNTEVQQLAHNELKRYSDDYETILSALLWQLKQNPEKPNKKLYAMIEDFLNENNIKQLYDFISTLKPTTAISKELKKIVLDFEMKNS